MLTAPTGQFCFRLFMTFNEDIRSASTYCSTPLDVLNQVVHIDTSIQNTADMKVCVHRVINRHGHYHAIDEWNVVHSLFGRYA